MNPNSFTSISDTTKLAISFGNKNDISKLEGNLDVKPDTITFNGVIDAWARSHDRRAPKRAEEILAHMNQLYQEGNYDVQPDTYTYNTVINCWAKSNEPGSAKRAEHILAIMEQNFKNGDASFRPNTRTHTSVIDAWAKSGERGAAKRAEQILNNMLIQAQNEGNADILPNTHTYNAVMNACAFTKSSSSSSSSSLGNSNCNSNDDLEEALGIAFRVFDALSLNRSNEHNLSSSSQIGDDNANLAPDAYTYTIMLSVCANLIPLPHDHHHHHQYSNHHHQYQHQHGNDHRFQNAKLLFERCCADGYVNDFVLRKLRQAVTPDQFLELVHSSSAIPMPVSFGSHHNVSVNDLPHSWTRKIQPQGRHNSSFSQHGRGGRNHKGGGSGNSVSSGRSNYHHHNNHQRGGGRRHHNHGRNGNRGRR